MILKSLAAAAIALTASITGAAAAQADVGDVDSYGTFGDSNLGFSAGTEGYSASLAGNTLTTWGFPHSYTTITGMGYSYAADTDYAYNGLGIEHHSSLTSDSLSFTNEFEVTPMELSQDADVRVGSTQITCKNFVCMVGGMEMP